MNGNDVVGTLVDCPPPQNGIVKKKHVKLSKFILNTYFGQNVMIQCDFHEWNESTSDILPIK